ncbi:MAG: hypothetical protein K0S33_1097 [Bacteroidetes bacterium]|jgi:hypothetical protein|nr:hypothetical protein [Bacteroidota bacterium]
MKKTLLTLFTAVSMVAMADKNASLIDLVSFEALQNNGKIDIKWVTKAEYVNSYFVVERSKDGKTYEEVLKVPGNGKGNFYMEYFDADYTPSEGLSYYRLKQITTGSEEIIHSNIVVNYFKPVAVTSPEIAIAQSPDHDEQDFSLLLKGFEGKEVLVVLRDKAGNEYFSKVFLSSTQHYLAALDPEQTLVPGEYLITASTNNKIYSKKVKVR